MSKTEQLGSIKYHTDSDTDMYQAGEVDGGFDDRKLKEFIKHYGSDGLIKKLAYMSCTVIEVQRKVDWEADMHIEAQERKDKEV
jgi:hypothetical protein